MIEVSEDVLSAPTAENQRQSAASQGPRTARNQGSAAKKSLRIDRTFSNPKIHPFDEAEWEKRTAEITDDAGKVIFKQEDVGAKILVNAGHEGGRLQILLWRTGEDGA